MHITANTMMMNMQTCCCMMMKHDMVYFLAPQWRK